MKKIILIVCLMFSLMFCTSCNLGQIEDTNGEDNYSLETISDEPIVSGTNTVEVMSSHLVISDKATFKSKKLSGVKTLLEEDVYNGATLTFTFTVTSGNGVVALVSGNEIYQKIEANQTIKVEITDSKDYEIKVAGESLNYKLEIQID